MRFFDLVAYWGGLIFGFAVLICVLALIVGFGLDVYLKRRIRLEQERELEKQIRRFRKEINRDDI